jgi:hypothetical protein
MREISVAFFQGSVKVNLRKFFTVTTMVLFVVAAQLFVSGVHELSEAQVLPFGPTCGAKSSPKKQGFTGLGSGSI